MKTIENLGNLEGKTVLLRADFNVPLDGTRITDDGRIKAAMPTIAFLLSHKVKIVITAHLGRPKGKVNPAFSLAPVAKRLDELVNTKVVLAKDVVGDSAKETVANLEVGEIAILENVRFDPRETSKVESERESFANQLADLADVFVSDGFGVVHRKQASVYDVAKILPSAAGLLVEKEVRALSRATENPVRPLCVVLGGAKVSDKLGVIENLLDKADTLLIGGGMAYTFLKAKGYEVGTSLLEEDQVDACAGYMKVAKEKGVELVLPQDVLTAPEIGSHDVEEVNIADIAPSKMGLDIGRETKDTFARYIVDSKTLVWNGPMGVFENELFASGTRLIAEAFAGATRAGAFSIIGGGDSAAAVRQMGFSDDSFSHISTGGGASLEFLEGKELPGLAVLE
jgi:phosphoglycerate kinase